MSQCSNNPGSAPVPAAPTRPTIKALKLNNTNFDRIEQLDMGKHNRPTWSESMMNLLLLNSRGGCLLGTIPRPIDAESPSIWDTNNLCVIAAMKTCCTRGESLLLRNASNAKDAWDTLRLRHGRFGRVAQILLMQEALGVRFKRSDRLVTTAMQLLDIVDRIYAIGVPQQDDLLLIFLMNALSAEFPALRNRIANRVNAGTTTDPYTSARALRCLDMEQQLIGGEKQRQGSSFALPATASNAKPGQKSTRHCGIRSQTGHDTCCTNCEGTGHSRKQCWCPGGGRARERDPILAEKRAAKAEVEVAGAPAKPPAESSTGGNLRCDASRRA